MAAHMGRSVRLIAVEMAFEKTPAIPRYRRTKNLTDVFMSTIVEKGMVSTPENDRRLKHA
jgi:hypothetical protein